MPRSGKGLRQLIADSNERLSIRVGELEKAEPMQSPDKQMGHGGRVGRSGHAGIVHRAAHT